MSPGTARISLFKDAAYTALGYGILISITAAITAAVDFTEGSSPKDHAQTLEARISELTTSLNNSAIIISSVESEIAQRRDLVRKLQSDADEAKKLSTLDAAQVAAVSQALRGELHHESQSGFWFNALENLLFVILGALLGEGIRWLRERRVEDKS